MTGKFNPPNEEKCAYYAALIPTTMSRQEADFIFWGLFVTMIVLLIIVAQMYTKYVGMMFVFLLVAGLSPQTSTQQQHP
jgi:hypothetical protein